MNRKQKRCVECEWATGERRLPMTGLLRYATLWDQDAFRLCDVMGTPTVNYNDSGA